MKKRMIERTAVCLLLLTAIFAGSAFTAAAGTGTAKIVVFVYNDVNKNGNFDPGEQGLANWTIQLLGGNNGWSPIGGIPIRGTAPMLPTPLLITNATGYNTTTNVSDGTYFLAENEQNWVNGWVPSTMPDGITVKWVTVKNGVTYQNGKAVSQINFAVFCRPQQTCTPHS